jgi:hypothetical protein
MCGIFKQKVPEKHKVNFMNNGWEAKTLLKILTARSDSEK